MASSWYNRGKGHVLDGTIDLTNDTIKVMLVTSSYTPNIDHDYATTPAANELSGTGYASGFAGAGRKTLASKAFSVDDTNDRGEFDAADTTWTAINAGTAAYAIIYKHITDDASSPLIAWVEISPAVVTNGGDFTISWNAEGILHIT